MGGSSDGGDGGTQLYVYDIATNTWFSGSDLPRAVIAQHPLRERTGVPDRRVTLISSEANVR